MVQPSPTGGEGPKTSNPKTGIKIKVVCRVRPFLNGEEEDNSVKVNFEEKSLVVVNQRNSSEVLKYSFDNCYDSDASQETVFKDNVLPLLQEVFRGLDATVFCYGMTGAGKTHTIQGTAAHPGLIPQSMRAIFQRREDFIAEAAPGVTNKFEVRISYMEIYKEAVYDLLKPRDPAMKEGLMVREDANRNVFVAGLEIKEMQSLAQFDQEFTKACKNRATAATRLNQQSSRSHAILGVNIKIEDGSSKKTFRGKLNMIDLAGSEDNRRTGNDSMRLDESKAINTSLLVLGKVVDAINSRASRIPYRDSKMTRILQSSLGGKSLGMMFVNIAPAKKFFQETYQALNFATKSKEIVNNAVANEIKEVHKVRNVSLQSLSSKQPALSRAPSKTGVSQTGVTKPGFNKSGATQTGVAKPEVNKPICPPTDSDYRELASMLNDSTKKSNAEALKRYANKRKAEGNFKEALISFKQAQEFSPNDPELKATIQQLTVQMASPCKKSKIELSPGMERKAKILASSYLSSPRVHKTNSKSLPSLSSPEPDSPLKLFTAHTPIPNSSLTKECNTESLLATARALRHQRRSEKISASTPAKKAKTVMTEEESVFAALKDSSHPLLALFQMGKPDMLKGIWPSGKKTRTSVADFVQANGLNVLGELVPDALSEKKLLKAIKKFNAQ